MMTCRCMKLAQDSQTSHHRTNVYLLAGISLSTCIKRANPVAWPAGRRSNRIILVAAKVTEGPDKLDTEVGSKLASKSPAKPAVPLTGSGFIARSLLEQFLFMGLAVFYLYLVFS